MTNQTESFTFISRWIKRAEQSVGVITLLLSIASFGVGVLVSNPVTGVFVALIAFGVFGAIEVFHVKAQADAQKRAAPLKQEYLFWAVFEKYPRWNFKVFKEFQHNGFQFRAVGFEESQIPLAITQPLCPTCKGSLTERIKVKFPGRTSIRFICSCGFSAHSDLTMVEMIAEAAELA